MITISKHDKKVWENYVSNFEKSVLFLKNDGLKRTQLRNSKIVTKKEKSLNSLKNFKKKKIEPDISLDLHGYTLFSAKLLLQKFITNCYEKNIRNVLIITGKGQNNKGALKEEVPKWLNDKSYNHYVVSFNVAPSQFGGEGALLVRIKNRFKKI
jgi:DNA-nicking Smr family endonuclease